MLVAGSNGYGTPFASVLRSTLHDLHLPGSPVTTKRNKGSIEARQAGKVGGRRGIASMAGDWKASKTGWPMARVGVSCEHREQPVTSRRPPQ